MNETTVPELLTVDFYTALEGDVLPDLKPYLAGKQEALTYLTAVYAYDLLANPQSSVMSTDFLAVRLAETFSEKWLRMAQALYADYNPIENYNMKEQGNTYEERGAETQSYQNFADTTTGTDTVISGQGHSTKSGTKAGNITVSDSGVSWDFVTDDELKTTGFVTTMDDVVNANETGYTSTTGAGSTVDTTQELHTYDISHGKEGEIHNSHTALSFSVPASDNLLNADINPDLANGHKLTRNGNIGVTTTQQMIEQEMLLRKQHMFLSIVVNDCVNATSAGVWK